MGESQDATVEILRACLRQAGRKRAQDDSTLFGIWVGARPFVSEEWLG